MLACLRPVEPDSLREPSKWVRTQRGVVHRVHRAGFTPPAVSPELSRRLLGGTTRVAMSDRALGDLGVEEGGRFLVVVAFLIERDGQVLLLKRSRDKDHAPGEWEVGSGRVRQGESAVDAVYREAKEETGLEVEVLGPLDTFHFYRGQSRTEAIGITFHCRTPGGDVRLSSEHEEAKWVPISQLADVECGGWMRRAFAAFLVHRCRRISGTRMVGC